MGGGGGGGKCEIIINKNSFYNCGYEIKCAPSSLPNSEDKEEGRQKKAVLSLSLPLPLPEHPPVGKKKKVNITYEYF